MKLSGDRTNVDTGNIPPDILQAFVMIGDYLNSFPQQPGKQSHDLATDFTIHRDGDSITYQLECKEVKRQPTLIDQDGNKLEWTS